MKRTYPGELMSVQPCVQISINGVCLVVLFDSLNGY